MKKLFYFFKVSFVKSVQDLIRYKFNTLTNIATFYFLFMAMLLGLKILGNTLSSSPLKIGSSIDTFIIAYFLWTVMYMAYANIAYAIINDASKGTLEQIAMSNLGLHSVVIVRGICETIINFIMCFVVLFLAMYTSGRWINVKALQIIVILFIGMFSMFGIGLIFGGLAIIFKRINAVLNLVQYFLIGLTMIDTTQLASIFIPFVPAINMVYKLSLGESTLLSFSIQNYIILIANSVLFFSIGLFVFKYCCNKAKKKGLLGQY
ncbi:hypothetical protein JYG23_10435 [Sedimentibacter sp. zth1]|uniref:hypothetical protein n=1 Tax=Sedimentibacter sp. zth1 TaxID=2816908 RepID=UPI001A92DE4D|nr:hypothetical protein [Sedimentibacter sp. zth1]QSX05102.1 hypothetical protein JYG23_10435 [Sedimentibacter sp. zth1]